jgi:5-methylcytosine-specific restriction endonuclease McrA
MTRAALTGRPWRRTRLLVLERDGGICHLCHLPGATTVDHLVPAALGGGDDLANLAAAHVPCNSAKGARLPLPRSRVATPRP